MPSRPPDPPLPLRAFVTVAVLAVVTVGVGFLEEERREWRTYQERYRQMEIDRAASAEEREAARRLPIRLRQIWVPELEAVDRCISCHVAVDDPTYAAVDQPFAYHPGHDLHPFERFGCTVCHQGQGRATTVEAAHGDVAFWNRPMLPLRYVEASCGACHEPEDNPAAPRLARGARLFEEAGCRGCHSLDGWGGRAGPDLDRPPAGRPRSPDWLTAHFLDPSEVVPGSAMPRYGFTEDEAEVLTLFVLSVLREEVGGYHASRRILESAERGRTIFQRKGCIGCHSIAGTGGDVGPALDDVVSRRTETWLLDHFRDPRAVSPGSVMPAFGFSEGEARSLVLYLHYLHEVGARAAGPPERTPEQRGEWLFKYHGCRGCHGPAGQGGVPNANAESGEQIPPLVYVRESYTPEELADRIRGGVASVGKLDPQGPPPPLAMPAFARRLTDRQIEDLVRFLFSLYPEEEALDW